LEWIQKIDRDTKLRGYSQEAVVDSIHSRMSDYVTYIVPQFSRTHINFQRVPTVDTSNPFIVQDVPSSDESMVVIRFKDRFSVDFPYLISMIRDSFMTRPDTLVIPGGKMGLAMELILTPRIHELLESRRFR
jgi:phosphoribulokinase